MKIIDADKLHYKQVYIDTEKGPRPALVVFAKEIRKMPEIVRCKGCVFFRRYGFKLEHTCARFDCHAPKDGYCCWAERREDETG